VRDHEPLRVPRERMARRNPRAATAPEQRAPFARGAPLRSHEAVEPHQKPAPPGKGLRVETLNQIAHQGGSRSPVKKQNLVDQQAPPHHDLIDLGRPGVRRYSVELGIEIEVAPLSRQAGRRVEASLRVTRRPLSEIQVVELVGRYQMADRTKGVDRLSKRGIE